MHVDTAGWSGEGEFTRVLVERLQQIDAVAYLRIEDAPASRSEADYNFICNEIYVRFLTRQRRQFVRRFGLLPGSRVISEKAMDVRGLEASLSEMVDIGAPDYSDEGMLQYLRTERIVPPYQTKGFKLVELVRIYEAKGGSRIGKSGNLEIG
jgi:hypothetical protein